MRSFGNQGGARPSRIATRHEMFANRFELRRLGHEPVGDPPRVEDGLGEHETRVAWQLGLIAVASVANDREDRQLPVVQCIAEGVARLEETGALNHHERGGTAEVKSRGDLPSLAFTTDANESEARALDGRFPAAYRAVGHGDNVCDAELREERCNLIA